ncbi:F-box only protein 46 [Struthio camelus]|uniref:F-box only protein 46 n=1 Tax=Struthio camelus TaxID=8801 RepID=UPI003603C093
MEPDAFRPVQLWCPRPFGTFSQNQPRGPAPARRPAVPKAPRRESTPPPPPPPPPPDEGRVLLDTWYVIKPGNTKEKIAFFVAHQCGGARAATMKVKGHWGGESCKAKRRRRSREPAEGKAGGGRAAEPGSPPAPEPPPADLLSVAEMVALVERRTALALQSYGPLPCAAGPGSPRVLFVAADEAAGGGGAEAPGGPECRRVAEAVARFESRQQRPAGVQPPGEVRIAFRISSEPRAAPQTGARSGPGLSGPRAKDKITCDLYQLISPSRDALPADVQLLLAGASPATDGPGGEPGGRATPGQPDGEDEATTAAAVTSCGAGFHVDVVVTGAVDECVFLGKDSSKAVTEETVCLAGSPATAEGLRTPRDEPPSPPPPGQLFLLPGPAEETREAEGAEMTAAAAAPPPPPADSSLCRLYRHVSHDFLEIRFKIQRLLEPRQYMLLLPEHVMVKIFSYLPTQALAALKCSCHYFKSIIETFGVQATDSRWNRDPLYRDDPCKQCKKLYARGDVSLCRWHPKPYHHDLPYGRSYWMCCRRAERQAPGCRVGLHDNNWVPPGARPAARRHEAT